MQLLILILLPTLLDSLLPSPLLPVLPPFALLHLPSLSPSFSPPSLPPPPLRPFLLPSWCHRKCGGCTRAHGESKPFAISISGREGLVVAAASEEELTQWMQSLCEAVTSSRVGTTITPYFLTVQLSVHLPFQCLHSQSSPLPDCRRTCLSCAVLLTQNKVYLRIRLAELA